MGFAQLAGWGFSPLDEELQLVPGSLTPSLQEGLVRLGTWMPFEKAGEMLVDFMRLSAVSEAMVRRHTEAAGAAYVAVQEQAVRELEQSLPPPPAGPEKLVLEVDGAMVPLVGGQWREVKTLLIGAVGQPVLVQGEWQVPLEEISSFSRLTDCESFARLALVETHRRGVASAGQVGALSDGAEWIPGFVDFHRPDAVRILDFSHGAEYVAGIGQGVLGEGTEATKEWLGKQLHCLKHQGGRVVLAQLRAFIQSHNQVAKLGPLLAYLEKRERQMQYPSFRAAGWPIGSGAVESANKLVVEARLKGAGMHWAPQNVDPMLALRNIVCSDRWAEAWPQIAVYLRQQAASQRQERRQKRRKAQPIGAGKGCPGPVEEMCELKAGTLSAPDAPEPLPVAEQPLDTMASSQRGTPYRPAPDHPWRRFPIVRPQCRPTLSDASPKI